jgi:co-chaperonin GroES (HSP10)
MNFRPLSGWILLALEPPAVRSKLLEVPGGGHSAVRKARVVAVGEGKPLKRGVEPMFVQPGERVAFLRWHGEHQPGKANAKALEQIGLDMGEDLLLVRQADILFVLDGCDPTLDM